MFMGACNGDAVPPRCTVIITKADTLLVLFISSSLARFSIQVLGVFFDPCLVR